TSLTYTLPIYVTTAVTYNPKSETVTLPGGLTSVAGLTVVTGGAELSCRSCMMAFCFWKALVGFSCIAVGLWDQVNNIKEGTSHLLGLGIVILALCFVVILCMVAYALLKKKKREDGREVLVESKRVIKKVTV
uniref:Uncharacterized protein n=1 Tax=Monopterus albus TaxID=43700 RepID=A0A3Q3J743_MONAL